MQRNPARILAAAFFLSAAWCARAAAADSRAPGPSPSPAGSNVVFSGQVRAYYFTRTNQIQDSSNPNRAATNFGVRLHAEYPIAGTALFLGATYFGVDPFGANGPDPAKNPKIDNTLPGFGMGTLGEAYVAYKSPQFAAKIGNQQIAMPWSPPSDTRIKPALYQGLEGQWNPNEHWTIFFDRIIRFESRTSSQFSGTTLITSAQPGNPVYPFHTTAGFLQVGLGYKANAQLSAAAYFYHFSDIANLIWIESRFFPWRASPLHPYLAAQFARERQTGAADAGIIDSQTFGAQIGANFGPNLSAAFGFDIAPWRTATAAGADCSGAALLYFLPSGGTPGCKISGGSAIVAYGGLASPYTDSYTGDPIFTTSFIQSSVDRHSAGETYRLAVTVQPNDRRFRIILGGTLGNYGNVLGPNLTRSFDADATYYFSKVSSNSYRGWSLRHRYGDRVQPTVPFDFKYNRTQLEYDF
jgi:hypothetical protein